jgi:hypothetical protein
MRMSRTKEGKSAVAVATTGRKMPKARCAISGRTAKAMGNGTIPCGRKAKFAWSLLIGDNFHGDELDPSLPQYPFSDVQELSNFGGMLGPICDDPGKGEHQSGACRLWVSIAIHVKDGYSNDGTPNIGDLPIVVVALDSLLHISTVPTDTRKERREQSFISQCPVLLSASFAAWAIVAGFPSKLSIHSSKTDTLAILHSLFSEDSMYFPLRRKYSNGSWKSVYNMLSRRRASTCLKQLCVFSYPWFRVTHEGLVPVD